MISEAGLSTRTVAKIAKGEKLSARSLNRIAGYLNVAPELLYRKESDNKNGCGTNRDLRISKSRLWRYKNDKFSGTSVPLCRCF